MARVKQNHVHGSERVVLGIESSCDDTGAAIIKGHTVLGEALATQAEIHAKWGVCVCVCVCV